MAWAHCYWFDESFRRILRARYSLISLCRGTGWQNFCHGILIPVVFAAMADEHAALCFDFFNQIAPLQASSNSECWRTFGTTPEDKSLYRSRRCSFKSSNEVPWVM